MITRLQTASEYKEGTAPDVANLYRASESGDAATVRAIIYDERFSYEDIVHHGTPALFIATERGDAPIVQLLLIARINPNSRDSQMKTPFIIAAQHGRINCLKQLLCYRLDISAECADGKPVFQYATEYNESCRSDETKTPIPHDILKQLSTPTDILPSEPESHCCLCM